MKHEINEKGGGSTDLTFAHVIWSMLVRLQKFRVVRTAFVVCQSWILQLQMKKIRISLGMLILKVSSKRWDIKKSTSFGFSVTSQLVESGQRLKDLANLCLPYHLGEFGKVVWPLRSQWKLLENQIFNRGSPGGLSTNGWRCEWHRRRRGWLCFEVAGWRVDKTIRV